jgi:hypothetical protein
MNVGYGELASVHEVLGFGRGLRVNVCFRPRTDYAALSSLFSSNTRYTYGKLLCAFPIQILYMQLHRLVRN